jgi:hypothetical protein
MNLAVGLQPVEAVEVGVPIASSVGAGVQVADGVTVGVDVGSGVNVGRGVDVGTEVTVGTTMGSVGCAVGVCVDGAQPAIIMLNRVRNANALSKMPFIVYLLDLPQRRAAPTLIRLSIYSSFP